MKSYNRTASGSHIDETVLIDIFVIAKEWHTNIDLNDETPLHLHKMEEIVDE